MADLSSSKSLYVYRICGFTEKGESRWPVYIYLFYILFLEIFNDIDGFSI